MNPSRAIEQTTTSGGFSQGSARVQRVLHMASGDGWGGAERVLQVLVKSSLESGAAAIDCLLLNEGTLADVLRRMGARVYVIEESTRSFPALARDVRTWVRAREFDVVHCHPGDEPGVVVLRNLIGGAVYELPPVPDDGRGLVQENGPNL